MVYECEKCNAPLPAGAISCPECGDEFDRAVPSDAEVLARGWRPRPNSAGPAEAPPAPSDQVAPAPSKGSYPDYILPDEQDGEHWRSGMEKAMEAAGKAAASPLGRRLLQHPLWVVAGTLVVLLVVIGVTRSHTSTYVFNQHPLYQANMASFTDVARSRHIDYVWPYDGHEAWLKVIYHPDSYGDTSPSAMSKRDLDLAAVTDRLGFCAVRYRSGFTPDEAMQCRVYAFYDGSQDTGYDGPDVAPDRDAVVKGRLDQVQ